MNNLTKTKKLIRDFKGWDFYSGTYIHENGMTKETKSFFKRLKNALAEQMGDQYEIIGGKMNWYTTSGFVKHKETGKLVYFSISDVRFSQDRWIDDILIRTAQHDKDWTGGSNNYTELTSFKENVENLLKRGW